MNPSIESTTLRPHSRHLFRLLAVGAVPLAIAACGGGGGGETAQLPDPAEPQAIAIEFVAKAGTDPVQCGTPIPALGTESVNAELHDLRFYISNVRLIDGQGQAVPLTMDVDDWQNGEVALIDLEDGTGECAEKGTPATNARILGTIPAGDYTGIRLTLGVPSNHNHTDFAVAATPMDVQAMAWSWQAGRKFASIEVNPEGGVARPAPAAPGNTFHVHLGSTGCTGNPVTGETVQCERPNRMDFSFPAFDAATQRIAVDLAALFAASRLNDDQGGAAGCMSGATDPECAPVFQAMQIDLASGEPIAAGERQTLFRAEAR